MSTLKTKLELDQLTNAEHKENPTAQQAVLDEAGIERLKQLAEASHG